MNNTNMIENDFDKCRVTLRLLLFKNNINATELARAINIPQPTIQRILAGKTEDPKLSTLTAIANYFSLTLDQLLGNAPLTDVVFLKKTQKAPVISWEKASQFKEFFESNEIKDWKNWISIDTKTSSSFIFGLQTKPSMEPRFIAGSILTIDPDKKPVDGDLVIVHYPNIPEATIREITLDGPKHELSSITEQSTEKLSKDINIIGVVVQTRFSYV